MASILPDLIRRGWGNPASIGIGRQLIAVSSGELAITACVLVIVLFDDRLSAADAICAGVACAFGFVIAYIGELVVPLLTMVIGVPAHMLGIEPLVKLTKTWLTYLPYGDQGNPVPHADLVIFYLLAPALAGLTAFGAWSIRHGAKSPRIAIMAATALLASVPYVIPLYSNSFLVAGFGQDAQSTPLSIDVAQSAYLKSVLYLALPILLTAWFMYGKIPKTRLSRTTVLERTATGTALQP
jgi:hypothetical protein